MPRSFTFECKQGLENPLIEVGCRDIPSTEHTSITTFHWLDLSQPSHPAIHPDSGFKILCQVRDSYWHSRTMQSGPRTSQSQATEGRGKISCSSSRILLIFEPLSQIHKAYRRSDSTHIRRPHLVILRPFSPKKKSDVPFLSWTFGIHFSSLLDPP